MDEVITGTNAVEMVDAFRQKTDAVQAFIMEHVRDSHTLELPFLTLELPEFLSLHGFMVIMTAVVLMVIALFIRRKQDDVPRGLANLVELFVVFIRDNIAVPYLGEVDGRKFTPRFCTFFSFIAMANLLGLIPSVPSPTTNISVPLALSMVTLGFMVVGAVIRNGFVGFFKGLMPSGVPWPILIILVPIEFIGLFIRAGALTIRLFANILAGHLVLLNLFSLVVIFGIVALPVVALALVVYMIEIFVAIFQAYIFTMLSAVFIGQQYHPAH
jgi:F-type H+-transporting ATPase subunit a